MKDFGCIVVFKKNEFGFVVVEKNEVMDEVMKVLNKYNRYNYEFKTTAFNDFFDVLIKDDKIIFKDDEILFNRDDLKAFVSKVTSDESTPYPYTVDLMLTLYAFKKYISSTLWGTWEKAGVDILFLESLIVEVEDSGWSYEPGRGSYIKDHERIRYKRKFLENNREFYYLLCGY